MSGCRIKGCKKKVEYVTAGLCRPHYSMRRVKQTFGGECSNDGCAREIYHLSKQLCRRCYMLLRLPKNGKKKRKIRSLLGFYITSNGYRKIRTPTGEWVLEHRYLMERHIGRALLDGENVHHKNADRLDNRIDNLELWVKPQPQGMRVEDAIAWASEILARYGAGPLTSS